MTAITAFNIMYIDILEVIPADETRTMKTAELSDRAREIIAEALEKREGKA